MPEKLDKIVIRELLEEADRKWFSQNSANYNYQGHLDFVVGYIVRNYGRCKKQKSSKV